MLAAIEKHTNSTLEEFLANEISKELLRFTTAGSVDDGKSTLIGRLLHDCKAVYEDQLASVRKSPVNRSGKDIDFSLLTDGLRAEREQGITIDVAYRYFSTPRRKFIIADTPGHEQYTRNMATGASTADLAIILIDATKGLLPQTRRHTYIASLLGIPQVVAAINKMDLVGYREDVYARLRSDFAALAGSLGIQSARCIPISALEGDNIVDRSKHMSWYAGPMLLQHLETVSLRAEEESGLFRFPVQSVIRPDASFRGFAGRIASGTVRPGDPVIALPSRQRTRIDSIVNFDGDLEIARPGQSIVLKLADEIDLSRGDMLVSPEALPQISGRFAANVVWLHETPLKTNGRFLAKHGSRYVQARAAQIRHRVDVNTLEELNSSELGINEIGSVDFETSQPLFFDPYSANRTTGSLILIDPLTNATAGAAMIRGTLTPPSGNRLRVVGHARTPPQYSDLFESRVRRHAHHPAILSLTGDRHRAEELERALHDRGFEVALVNHHEIPTISREIFYAKLWSLGLVILNWHEKPLRLRDRGLLDRLAKERHFELTLNESGFQRAISFTGALRIDPGSSDGGQH